jgi:hypothetical protein
MTTMTLRRTRPALPRRRVTVPAFTLAAVAAVALISAPATHAMPGAHLWSRGWDATGESAIADDGSVAAAGTFFGAINFGVGHTHTAGNFVGGDVFLVRYGPAGSIAWSRSFTPTLNGVVVKSCQVDPAGDIYVAGQTVTGQIDFGGGPLGGSSEMWIAKFDSAGNHLWSASYGPGELTDLAVGTAGLAVTGFSSGTVDFGGGALPTYGGFDVFVARLDPNGAHVGSRSFGDSSNQRGRAVTMSTSGGVALTGTMQGTVDFGGGPLVSGGTDIFLVRLDASGSHVWSQIFSGGFGAGAFVGLDLALDAAGNLALCGTLLGGTDFGGGPLDGDGVADACLGIFDSGGTHLFSAAYGTPALSDSAQGLAVDPAGTFLLSGTFEGTVDFGAGPLTSNGAADVFVAGITPAGTTIWSRRAGTVNVEQRCEVSASASGALVLFGRASNGINFGGGPLADAQFYCAKLQGATTIVDAPVASPAALGAGSFPNPFRESTRIRFASTHGQTAGQVTIHDVTGRTLRTLTAAGAVTGGTASVVWDGRDERGRLAPAGVYFWRAGSGTAGTGAGRITRLR